MLRSGGKGKKATLLSQYPLLTNLILSLSSESLIRTSGSGYPENLRIIPGFFYGTDSPDTALFFHLSPIDRPASISQNQHSPENTLAASPSFALLISIGPSIWQTSGDFEKKLFRSSISELRIKIRKQSGKRAQLKKPARRLYRLIREMQLQQKTETLRVIPASPYFSSCVVHTPDSFSERITQKVANFSRCSFSFSSLLLASATLLILLAILLLLILLATDKRNDEVRPDATVISGVWLYPANSAGLNTSPKNLLRFFSWLVLLRSRQLFKFHSCQRCRIAFILKIHKH